MNPNNNNNKSKKNPRKSNQTRTLTMSRFVPHKDYLSTHVAGVTQNLRRTLTFSLFNSSNIVTSTYTEPFVVVMNNPLDPAHAISGAAATGFAKYMAFYSKCFCLGSRLKVKVANPTAGSSFIIGTTVTTNSASLTGVNLAIGAGLTEYAVIGDSPNRSQINSSLDVGRFLDKPIVLDDPQLFCTSTVDVSQIIVAHFWAWNYGAATAVLNYVIEVEFDVVFTDPIPFT